MVRNKRLSKEERKKEIMSSGARFFIEKGFSQTTMEDIISGTTLSKGGVYHYYNNTIDILGDLMREGNKYRLSLIKESIDNYNSEDDLYFLASEIVKKMLDTNEFMPLYVDFLIESKRNDQLKKLYNQLKEETIGEYYKVSKDLDKNLLLRATDDFIMHLTNSIIIGGEVLEARDSFIENKDILISMVKIYLEKTLKERAL